MKPPVFYMDNSITRSLYSVLFTNGFGLFHNLLVLVNLVLLGSFKSMDLTDSSSASIALTALQSTLLAILCLMCVALGIHTAFKDPAIKFEFMIAIACFVDCLIHKRRYSTYSTLTSFRLIGSLQKVIRFKQYQIAVEFMTNIASVVIYFLVLTVKFETKLSRC